MREVGVSGVMMVNDQCVVSAIDDRRPGSTAMVDYKDVFGSMLRHSLALLFAMDGVPFGEQMDCDKIFGKAKYHQGMS